MICTAIEKRILAEGQPKIDLRYCEGRVSGDGLPDRAMGFYEFGSALRSGTAEFIGLVERANPGRCSCKIKTDTPLTIEHEKEVDGQWHLEIKLGDLAVDLFYNPNVVPPTATVKRPGAFNIEWQTYLLWVEAMTRFVSTVQVAYCLDATPK